MKTRKSNIRYIGALVGHPRSGTSYFKRVVHFASAVSPTFTHAYGSIVGRWDQRQAYDERFVFEVNCPHKNVVLLERDARDICVSGWFFIKYRLQAEDIGTEQEFVDRAMPFITNWQEGARVFVPPERRIQYTEMTEHQAVTRALAGMGARASNPESIQAAIDGLAFTKMQRRDRAGGFTRGRSNHYEAAGNDDRALSFRAGKSGAWETFPADFSRWS